MIESAHKLRSVSTTALQPIKREQQQGAVLVVSLVILTVLTILGISAMQGSALAGKISSNYRLEQLITQAGEAALLEAERQIEGLDVAAIATDNCVNGYCTSRKTDANYVNSIGTACNNANHLEERWALPNSCTGNLDVWNTTGRSIEYTSSNLAQTSSVKARYIIEYLGLVPIVTTTSGTPPHTSHADCTATSPPPVTPCPEMFRITTLASDLSDRGRVMLQTTYQK